MISTLKQAAELTGLNYHTLRKRVDRGTLKATKMGTDWFLGDRELNKLKQEVWDIENAPPCKICGNPAKRAKGHSQSTAIPGWYATCGKLACIKKANGQKLRSSTVGVKFTPMSGATLTTMRAKATHCHRCGRPKELGKQCCASCLASGVGHSEAKRLVTNITNGLRNTFYLNTIKKQARERSLKDASTFFDQLAVKAKKSLEGK